MDAQGYTEATPIQEQAIPVVLAGRDLLGVAQTGTGKTAAFILPILQRLTGGQRPSSGTSRRVRALIVAPTRELAEQIHQTSVDLGAHTRTRSIAIYGGVSKNRQLAALGRGADIVVACPGRLLDHLRDGNIDISQIDVLVLDEADMMCDMGFLPAIRRILEYVPRQRQTLFFCATMPDEIRALSRDILTDPTTVQIGIMAPVETVSHTLYPIPEGLKPRMLQALLEHTATGRVLVFTRTKHRARRLARDLESRSYRVAALQGNMPQPRRQEALDGFRDGKYDILVATDIASRGIDVYEISHVINYDMPMTVDAYTHRIGRTGRAHATGEALTLMVPDDEALVRRIERVLRAKIPRRRLPDFDYGGFSPTSQSTAGRDGRGNGRVSAGSDGARRDGSMTGRPQRSDTRSFADPGGRPGGRPGYRAAPTGTGRNGASRRRRTNRRTGPSPSNPPQADAPA